MNDQLLMVDRLEELADLALEAENSFERATIYAATQAIKSEFGAIEDSLDGYTLEKLSSACWSIRASVGYDIANDHSVDQHVSWAHGQLSVLRDLIKERKVLEQ
ncbi:hypothetical protein [Marinobacter persicus]|uniref:hypothetical protein n=1 Tax=Marinobacter persicus TaxID=930118 RepID=UPI000CEAA9D1|nr:hypothetical protein [Marinobacter persicus]